MELKDDEPVHDGEQMDVMSPDHSENQIASIKSRPNVTNSRPSIAGQLAASRLVKKARLSLITKSRISSRPAATKPTSNNIAQANKVKPGDLSKETIDVIYESSVTLPNFATHLMTHLFDQTELLKCRNVLGRSHGGHYCNPDEALDERRVNTIRRLVEEKAGASDHTWKKCEKAMNEKIRRMKVDLNREKR